LRILTIELLGSGDLVAMAQCIAIDAEAFPYASAQFGMRYASSRVWVAREGLDAPVAGFLAARVRRELLHVEGVAVDPGVRRRGLGRALVREMVEHARALRLRAVQLHVSVTNGAAIALYEAEGFVIRRRLADFYPRSAFGETHALEMMRLF
jgi:ribosomal-protein-alanine N-acetyltransferase